MRLKENLNHTKCVASANNRQQDTEGEVEEARGRRRRKKHAQTEYAWSRSTTINEFQMKHKWLYSSIRRRRRRLSDDGGNGGSGGAFVYSVQRKIKGTDAMNIKIH